MAPGVDDPGAPDWFEPAPDEERGPVEAASSSSAVGNQRIKESEIVYEDDLSTSEESRLGTTTDPEVHADAGETTEAAAGEPEFTGEVPGFTDWREELRERLKRIRARRDAEHVAESGAENGDEVLEADAGLEVDEAPEAAEGEGAVEEAVLEPAEKTVEEEVLEAETDVDEKDVLEAEQETDEEEALEAEEGASGEEAGEDEQLETDEQVTVAAAQTGGQLLEQLVGDRVRDPDGITVDADAITLDGAAFDNMAEVIDLAEISRDTSDDDHGTTATEDLDDVEIADDDDDAELDLDMVDEVAESILDELKFRDDEAADEAAVPDPAERGWRGHEELVDEVTEAEEGETEEAVVEDLEKAEAEEDPAGDLDEAEPEEDAEEDPEEAEAVEDPAVDREGTEAEEDLLAEIEMVETAADPDTTKEAAETFDFDEAAIDLPSESEGNKVDRPSESEGNKVDRPAVVMPDLPERGDTAPQLDLVAGTEAVVLPTPEIDVSQGDAPADALTWDANAIRTDLPPKTRSSAGPLGERAAAAVCDMMVLLAIAGTLVSSAASVTGATLNQILSDAALPLAGAWSIFAIGYSVFFVGSCGQTIGRMVMHLRVVHVDQFSVGFKVAALRLAVWLAVIATLGIGLLPAIKDRKNRALHDRLTQTRVVKA